MSVTDFYIHICGQTTTAPCKQQGWALRITSSSVFINVQRRFSHFLFDFLFPFLPGAHPGQGCHWGRSSWWQCDPHRGVLGRNVTFLSFPFLWQGFQGKTGPPGPPGVVGPQVRSKCSPSPATGLHWFNWSCLCSRDSFSREGKALKFLRQVWNPLHGPSSPCWRVGMGFRQMEMGSVLWAQHNLV